MKAWIFMDKDSAPNVGMVLLSELNIDFILKMSQDCYADEMCLSFQRDSDGNLCICDSLGLENFVFVYYFFCGIVNFSFLILVSLS